MSESEYDQDAYNDGWSVGYEAGHEAGLESQAAQIAAQDKELGSLAGSLLEREEAIAALTANYALARADIDDLLAVNTEITADLDALAGLLAELVALVRGECPSLLDEDSGGSARLSMAIDDALAARTQAHKEPTC